MKHLIGRIVAMLVLLPALAMAQAQGRVKGKVTDTHGKPIANAKIILTCNEMGSFRKEIKVDKDGDFSTLVVDATKRYQFRVEAPGYQTIEQEHKPLIGGQTLEVDFQLKSMDEAQREAGEAMLEQPGIKELREARELLDEGKKQEARDKLQEAVTAKPDLHLAWLEMALLDLELGKPAEALQEAEKCLALQPDYVGCLGTAANAAKAKGDEALFQKYMTAYKAANPSDPAVLYNEAVGHLNKGDDAAAKPLLEQALEINQEYPEALFQLGMVYVRGGESAKAKELFERFLKVAPDHQEAPTAKEMMKYL